MLLVVNVVFICLVFDRLVMKMMGMVVVVGLVFSWWVILKLLICGISVLSMIMLGWILVVMCKVVLLLVVISIV